jgi:membrane protein implicated in regulation of membrane protease activity
MARQVPVLWLVILLLFVAAVVAPSVLGLSGNVLGLGRHVLGLRGRHWWQIALTIALSVAQLVLLIAATRETYQQKHQAGREDQEQQQESEEE